MLKLRDLNESLNKKYYLNEDYYSGAAEELTQFVSEKISDCMDNIAIVAASEFPWYNPDWCSDSAVDFADALRRASMEFTSLLLKNRSN